MTKPLFLVSVLSKPTVYEGQDSTDVTVQSTSATTESPPEAGAEGKPQGRQGHAGDRSLATRAKKWCFWNHSAPCRQLGVVSWRH